MVSTFYAVLSWVLIALGTAHMASASRIYSALTMPALWFFGGGLLIVVGAMLNLLNRMYGNLASGLQLATVATNVAVGSLAAVGGLLSSSSIAQFAVVVGLYVVVTALSCTRRAHLTTSHALEG